MPKAREIVPFTVIIDGTTYDCERVVDGSLIFTQTIRVNGVGSKSDSARYGPGQHPIPSMRGIAKLIAAEIVNECKPRDDKT